MKMASPSVKTLYTLLISLPLTGLSVKAGVPSICMYSILSSSFATTGISPSDGNPTAFTSAKLPTSSGRLLTLYNE